MSDSYDDYEMKIQLAEQAWEKRVMKTEHDRAVELAKAYERGWNAALAQQEPVAWISEGGDGLLPTNDPSMAYWITLQRLKRHLHSFSAHASTSNHIFLMRSASHRTVLPSA